MPNQTIQYPNIDLPGAEFFSLAPNRTIALQGRQRRFQVQQFTAPAGDPAFGSTESMLLEKPFPVSAGIYIHYAFLILIPVDPNQLVVESVFLGLNNSSVPGTVAFPLGVPFITQTTPGGPLVAVAERDLFVAQRDLIAQSNFPVAPPPGQLNMVWSVFVQNPDTTNAHAMTVFNQINYTRMDGIVE